MQKSCIVAAVAIASCLPALAAPEGFSEYRVVEFPREREFIDHALDMNERSQVVGRVSDVHGYLPDQGFRWTPNAGVELVRDFPSGYAEAQLEAINGRGTAVGYGTVHAAGDNVMRRALMLLSNGRRVTLPHPGEPSEHSRAVDINDADVAIGYVGFTAYHPLYAVRWNADGTVERLDVPGDVKRINNRGEIAGYWFNGYSYFRDANGVQHTFPITDVLHLGDDGTVAGRALGHPGRAALWTAQGGMEYLPRLPDRPRADCYAESMNRLGQVVGACSSTNNSDAVIWQRVGGAWQIAYLSSLVQDGALSMSSDSWAHKINDAGHTLLDGAGGDQRGLHTMILVPVTPAARQGD